MKTSEPAALLWVLSAALTSTGSRAETPKSWVGFVTDTHCGTNCQRTSDMKPDLACVRECVRRGSKYGLWYGHHVYELTPQSKAKRFAAENVRVKGRMENDVLHIESIALVPPGESAH
jgi:hypothetical protein